MEHTFRLCRFTSWLDCRLEAGRQHGQSQIFAQYRKVVSQIDAYSVQITFFLFLIIFTHTLIAEIKIMLSAIKNRTASLILGNRTFNF